MHHHRSPLRHLILPLLAALALPATGNAIQWNSATTGTTDADSGGAQLDDSWSFHLGAFTSPSKPPGWVPTSGNTDEWHLYWVTADVSGYFPPVPAPPDPPVIAGRFSSRHNVTGFIAGFTQGYIWGTNRAYPNGQWILMTNPNWIWPFPNPLNPAAVNWTLDSNTTAIVGAVNQGLYQMQTAAVSNSLPPLLSGENWREIHFTPDEIENQGATVSGWNADPNGNGRPNILEFAYDADPTAPGLENEPVTAVIEEAGNHYLTKTVTKDPNVAITYTGEVGPDLATWFEDSGNVLVQTNGLTELVFRDMVPISPAAPARSMRVRVTLP